MSTLFISDLHLDPERPQITDLFMNFLKTEARVTEALYILGDFFEIWIGDDDPDPHHARVMAGLRELAESGVPVYFMHGNRDFLIGDKFASKTRCTLLPDPYLIKLYGLPTLLMHGDTLCTDDVEYQAFRKIVRDPARQQAFLTKSVEERRAFMTQARAATKLHTQTKAEYIMDVNQQAVEAVMRQYSVTWLIHGHTHRPAIHKFQSGGQDQTRIVLGDWYEQGSMLTIDKNGIRLAALPLT
ncbi:MAG: UDP-2,3-diacylglucosamine diphosphatase [Gammaproteobacteria bacterium]